MASEQIVGRITDIRVYPIKSCGALEVFGYGGQMAPMLDNAVLTESGLETVDGVRDHEYMFVNAEPVGGIYQKITQRGKRGSADRPQGLADLARIKPQFMNGDLHLTWDRIDRILLPLDQNEGEERPVQIWEDRCMAVDQGDDIAQWASEHLNFPVRLVKAAGSFIRQASQSYWPTESLIRFQDGYAIHWFPHESVVDLNERARTLVGQSNGSLSYNDTQWQSFRPQLMAKGVSDGDSESEMPAQSEHQILRGTIAGVLFVQPKPCERCPMPRVNQETGELNPLDPNTVLSTYKLWKNRHGQLKTIFGENINPLGRGVVTLGDEIVATELRNPPLECGGR